jgi:hypothetical protein
MQVVDKRFGKKHCRTVFALVSEFFFIQSMVSSSSERGVVGEGGGVTGDEGVIVGHS